MSNTDELVKELKEVKRENLELEKQLTESEEKRKQEAREHHTPRDSKDLADWTKSDLHQFYVVVNDDGATIVGGALFLQQGNALQAASVFHNGIGKRCWIQTWLYNPSADKAEFRNYRVRFPQTVRAASRTALAHTVADF